MPALVDLHTHSHYSDGTLSPDELVAKAHANGVDVLALTDHDTVRGITQATAAANALGMRLLPGVEISVTWNKATVHVLGLGVDPANSALLNGLQGLLDYREHRARQIDASLAKARITDTYDEAAAMAKQGLISRTHFARILVQRGHASGLREVYKKFLTRGKPGHVNGEWASLEDCVAWIKGAGGRAVIAHPARYGYTRKKLLRLIAEFKEVGGQGLEVVSGSHSKDEMFVMGDHARKQELLASAGSDYHGPEQTWLQIGRLPKLPHGCTPVWKDWVENAA